jgi:AcrR family transcriptional regulator
MTKRISAEAWITFALATLAQEGFDSLKADVLARRLGITRGSFYWYFADLGTFHARVIAHWKEIATEAIITEIERHESHAARFDALLRLAFGRGAPVEIRMRYWAESNADAARAVRDIDRRRRRYIEQLLVDAGIAPALAATRARLVYWTYLGAALSRNTLTGQALDETVAGLKRIGLGGGERPASRRRRG